MGDELGACRELVEELLGERSQVQELEGESPDESRDQGKPQPNHLIETEPNVQRKTGNSGVLCDSQDGF